jgi:hypothetical protein
MLVVTNERALEHTEHSTIRRVEIHRVSSISSRGCDMIGSDWFLCCPNEPVELGDEFFGNSDHSVDDDWHGLVTEFNGSDIPFPSNEFLVSIQ